MTAGTLRRVVPVNLTVSDSSPQNQALNRLIESRAAALKFGARFYAAKPALLCKRLENYWRLWKREKKF